MPSAIEDVSSLAGEMIRDQDGRKIGEVKEIYAVGENDTPMWVAVETSTGLGRSKLVFIPIARLKQEEDQIRTPYSFQHIQESPEVEAADELSEEDDRLLRSYYSVGLADQEMVESARSYASQVPDEEEPAHKVDANEVEGPVRELDERPTPERVTEAEEEEESKADDEDDERRSTTAEDVLGENDDDSKGESEDDSKGESKDDTRGESEDDTKGESKDDTKDESEDDTEDESEEKSESKSEESEE